MTGGTRRGLVLGGGGVAGIAWESAMIATLQAGGIDLSGADVIVGTSAGSVVGAALRSGDVDSWYRTQLERAASDPVAAEFDSLAGLDAEPVMTAAMAAIEGATGDRDARARLGGFAVRSGARLDEQASVERIASLLITAEWPERELRVTVVDATEGDFRVLDRDSGVDLVRAVAASCAVPGVYPPVTIGGRPYMDGGMRSATNADVAEDCDRILVLSCGPEAPMSPLGPTLHRAAAELRVSRAVMVVEADAASIAAFGGNSLLLSSGPAAAEAGGRQASAVLDEVRRFWDA